MTLELEPLRQAMLDSWAWAQLQYALVFVHVVVLQLWTDMRTPEFWRLAKAVINGVVCAMLWTSAVCRLNMMSSYTTKPIFRWKYTSLMVMTAVSGWSPILLNEWPGWSRIGLALAMWFVMYGASRAWKKGPPYYARSDSGALDEEPRSNFGKLMEVIA